MNAPSGALTMALAIEMQLPENALARNQSALALLIERAAAGDTAAFEQIMIQTQHRVTGMSWRMLGNEADARDATQEVFLKVYKHLNRFQQDRDFFAWLYGITVNVCRTFLKRRRHQADQFSSLTAGEGEKAYSVATDQSDGEQTLMDAQRRELISKAIARLPEKERASIILREVDGFSTEEVARILKSSSTTVRSQISSARRKIRDYCRDYLKEQELL